MPGSLTIGRLFGIPIRLHYSWFLIAGLITLSLASHFQVTNRGWPLVTVWATAVVASLLFFVTLLLHELSHALVARRRRLRVRSITLFALGGLAHIEEEARSAWTEFWVAIAGPVTSFVIGLICLAAARAAAWTPEAGDATIAASIVGWLGYINIVLAVFNLIPGFPLDGGRVLRAILWAYSGDPDRATRQAAGAGRFIASLFIAVGLVRAFTGAGVGGLWLAFIGWFLLEAAGASLAQASVSAALRDVRVRDLLAPPRALDDVPGIGIDDRWRGQSTGEAEARPPRPVTLETTANEALRIMNHEDVHQLPVVSDGRLAGVITRRHIAQAVQSRAKRTD